MPDGRGGTKPCNTTGTGTATGYAEHAFAFDVAQRVTRVLTERGVVVRSTRSDDAGVGPCVDQRAATANDARAALTVSIHADSAPAAVDRGFHVAVADPALAPSQRGPSLDLARALVAGLEGQGFTPSTYRGEGGLDPRPDLAGLNLARVPAALVECANMRNPGEAAVLADPAGRQRYADGIAAGILATLGPAETRPAETRAEVQAAPVDSWCQRTTRTTTSSSSSRSRVLRSDSATSRASNPGYGPCASTSPVCGSTASTM